jgi:transcriptional regulator with XRE-family HTH domain
VDTDQGSRQATGVNLDDVVRAIIWDIRQDYGGNQARTARRLGLQQQNLSRIESGGGTSIESLSRICAALGEDPRAFFRRHELYRRTRGKTSQDRLAEDEIFRKLRLLLTPKSAKRLVNILDGLVERRVLVDSMNLAEAFLTWAVPQNPRRGGGNTPKRPKGRPRKHPEPDEQASP